MSEGLAPIRYRPVIRVFVSSTFADLKHERDALQRRVFRPLELLCAQRRFQFQAIDLRWGISAEAGLDHRTMRICFEELRRSQEVSPLPNFLILLGDRYGWRPLPEEIDKDEYQRLIDASEGNSAGRKLLERWYPLDENARRNRDEEPRIHVLRSRKPDYTEPEDWEPVQRTLWDLTNRAFPESGMRDRFKKPAAPDQPLRSIVRFQASATEQEIWRGALDIPKAREHVLAFFRTIDNLDAYPVDRIAPFIDVKEHARDSDLRHALSELKAELRTRLGDANAIDLKTHALLVPTTDEKGSAVLGPDGQQLIDVTEDHITELCDAVYARLESVITRQMDEYWGTTSDEVAPARLLELEQKEHSRLARERAPADAFVGRDDQLRRIREYLANDVRLPLVVHGGSGCGKTALLSMAVQEASQPGCMPIVRFIGWQPRSSDLRSLLSSLCEEMRLRHAIEGPLPGDVNELLRELREHFNGASNGNCIILFLDALDQLADTDNALSLHWLPFGPSLPLPEHVKVVISCLSGRHKDDPASRPWAALKGRKLPPAQYVNLDQLSPEEAKVLLAKRWLSQEARRTLTVEQEQAVLDRLETDSCRHPLYLRILFEEARLWRSDDPVPKLAPDVPGLLAALFDRLSAKANHGATLRCAMAYLASARRGLTENEILEVLFADKPYMRWLKHAAAKQPLPEDPARIPIAIWSRLRSDLRPYLTEQAAPGGTVLNFYHRQVAEFIRGRYLVTPSERRKRHQRLAEYFDHLADPGGDRTWTGHGTRGASELPFHLLSAGATAELASVLRDVAFASAKSAGGLVDDLLHDYQMAMTCFPVGHAEHRRIVQLASVFDRYAHGLRRYRHCSLQQALLGVAALAGADPHLRTQSTTLTQQQRAAGTLRIWSLVPEHRTRGVLQVPVAPDRIVEQCGSFNGNILLRYQNGECVELSRDFGIVARGVTPAFYASIMTTGGPLLMLGSANVAQLWALWPLGRPEIRTFPSPISVAACSEDGRFLALGCEDGSFAVHCPQQADASPIISGRFGASVLAAWFDSIADAVLVTRDGTVHSLQCESRQIRSMGYSTLPCGLACSAGSGRSCLLSQDNHLRTYCRGGSLAWEVVLPEKAHCLAFAPATAHARAVVVAGLEDGTAQMFDAGSGELQESIGVSDSSLQQVEIVFGSQCFLCRDSSHLVALVSRSSIADEADVCSWPARSRVLTARWNQRRGTLEAITPAGDRFVIQKPDGSAEADWHVSQLAKLDGPLDDARFLPDESIVALHRESDESQVWRHWADRCGSVRSRCLWRGRSFLNRGPCYIHVLGVAPCGSRYAMASSGGGQGDRYFCCGRLGSRFIWPRWVHWTNDIDDMTQLRGSARDGPPARILICHGRTHRLLDEGWGGGIRGRERGLAQSLSGISINNDGRRIAAVDWYHNLWVFEFDPNTPDLPPQGRIVLPRVAACELSASGHLCAALQLDMAVRLLSLDKHGEGRSLAVVLLPGQAHYIRLDESDRSLVISGHNFIQVVSF